MGTQQRKYLKKIRKPVLPKSREHVDKKKDADKTHCRSKDSIDSK